MSSRESEGEDIPFISQEKSQQPESEIQCTCCVNPRHNRWTTKRQIIFAIFNCLFAVINAIFLFTNLKHQNSNHEEYGRYEPEGFPEGTGGKTWHLPIGVRSPYTSIDPAVADAAWKDIVLNAEQGWVKIAQDEADRIGQQSVEFDDGSGQLFGMDVFHQLHCLNYLRKRTLLYAPVYPGNPGEEDIPMRYHIPHCIDSIRLSLQCHADLSVIPQRWAPGWIEPWAVWTNRHQCRNFESIRDWARTRGEHSPGGLTHPELGSVRDGLVNASALPIYNEEHDIEVDVTL